MPFGVAIAYVALENFFPPSSLAPVSLCFRLTLSHVLVPCFAASWSPLWLLEDAPKHGPSKLEDGNRTRAVFPNSAALHQPCAVSVASPGASVRPEREIMNGHRVSTAVSSVDIAGWPLVLSTLVHPVPLVTNIHSELLSAREPVLNPFVTRPRYTYWWRELGACRCQRGLHSRERRWDNIR